MKKQFYYLAAIILMMAMLKTNAQAQWQLGGNTGTSNAALGTITGGEFLPIITGNNERMRVDENGLVGIGTTGPSYLLDVNLGDINLNQTSATTSEAYRIGGNRVLWHNNNTSNLFVGVGAGASNTNTLGWGNTFVGFEAGTANTTGYRNTFIGKSAGANNTTGYMNNFIGDSAGFNNIDGVSNWFGGRMAGFANLGPIVGNSVAGSYNTYTGHRCGETNEHGYFNCFYGKEAGGNSIDGSDNCFYGVLSGYNNGQTGGFFEPGKLNCFYGRSSGLENIAGSNNCYYGAYSGRQGALGNNNSFFGSNSGEYSVGSNNVFVGAHAGESNLTGDNNTLVGAFAQVGVYPLTNATAIGARAFVTQSNSLILGSVNGINGATANTNIGIGTTAPAAKLHLLNTSETIGGFFNSTFNGAGCISLAARAGDASVLNIGVFGQAAPIATPLNIPTVLGLSALNNNSGVWGQGAGSSYNFGGVFEANNCPNSIINIGVYGSASNCYSNTIPGIAGYFQGNVFANNALLTSDQMFKDSIAGISNALSIINSLQPKQFTFKTDSFPYMNFNGGKQYGFIAQQVDSVLPEIVSSIIQPAIVDTSGATLMATFSFKALHYTELIPLTIAAIQELDSIAATKAGVCDLAGSTPAHYLPK
ncbi:MAG: tail fiber domain-containing protein, partial [Chitinophagales bacterium]|nr:tail fiber domain-containing protein [Chitinophagales bacterium]